MQSRRLPSLPSMLSAIDLPDRPRCYRPRHALPPPIVCAVLRLRFGPAWRARLLEDRLRRFARQQVCRVPRPEPWHYGQPFPH
jgi:hypothetical protein